MQPIAGENNLAKTASFLSPDVIGRSQLRQAPGAVDDKQLEELFVKSTYEPEEEG